MAILFRAVMRWATALLVLASAGCSGGGGDTTVPSYYEVWIDPVETPTTNAIVDLYGLATCDACPPSEALFGTCPPIQGPFASAIAIHWTNLTTGESGDAVHGIYGHQFWFFSYCTVTYSHRWYASVPLIFGPNEIELSATGPSANPGTDRVTVTRMPAVPQGLVAQARSADVLLSWNAVAGAESYDLLWSAEPELSPTTALVVAGVTSPYLDSGSLNAVRYYAVRAVAGGYSGPLSEVVFATVGWVPETIPFPPMVTTGADLALAIDLADRAHVHASRLGTVVNPWIYNDYATNAAGPWSWLAVAGVDDLAADIALGTDDSVHVTYIASAGVHAVLSGGTWSAEAFDTNAACYTSLALDGLDRAHVLYQQNQFTPTQTGLVRYATNAGGTWVSEVVDTTRFGCHQEGSKLSLALDHNAHAHALYLAGPTESGLRYATNGTGAWVPESVTVGYVRSLALALDAGGAPHAIWTDDSNTLVHATRQGPGAWVAETVDTFAFGPSLAIGPGGALHLSYFQYALGQLRYATGVAGIWQVLPLASASMGPTSIALDSQGFVHIAWFDGEVGYVTNR